MRGGEEMGSEGAPVGRAERLLALLEHASTSAAVRMMVAKQVSSHVEALLSIADETATTQANTILNKLVRTLLTSKNWDVRVAANMAMATSASHIAIHEQVELTVPDDAERALKLLKNFDLAKFVQLHRPLVASSGIEFEVDLSVISTTERINQQKKQLKKTFELMEGLDDLANDFIEDQDLVEGGSGTKTESSLENKQPSVREKAMLRRKSRQQSCVEVQPVAGGKAIAKLDIPEGGEIFLEAIQGDSTLRTLLTLRSNVLNSNWTVRHGSLLGIKSLIRPHGRILSILLIAMIAQDTLAVLALDRFGDFVGDQTVVPVRETAAQVLTIVFCLLEGYPLLKSVIWENVLCMAQYKSDWQVRHSGLICIKYLSAVDESILASSPNFAAIFALGLAGCEDGDEDVRSLSTELLCRLISRDNDVGKQSITTEKIDLSAIRACVMDILQDVDEDPSIAVSTLVHALDLLAQVKDKQDNTSNIFLLATWMRHPMSAIREKVLKVLEIMDLGSLKPPVSILLLRLLVQTIILEDQESVRAKAVIISNHIITYLRPDPKLLAAYVSLCSILLTAWTRPLDAKHFVFVAGPDGGLDEELPLLTCTPAAHEIGFKAADIMVLKETTVVEGRRLASRIVSQVSALYDSMIHRRIAGALIAKEDPLSQCVALWLFGDSLEELNFVNRHDDKSGGNLIPDDIWRLRLWCAAKLCRVNDPVEQEFLVRYIGLEDNRALVPDAALLVQRSLDNYSLLLDAILDPLTRVNALPILIKVLNDIFSDYGAVKVPGTLLSTKPKDLTESNFKNDSLSKDDNVHGTVSHESSLLIDQSHTILSVPAGSSIEIQLAAELVLANVLPSFQLEERIKEKQELLLNGLQIEDDKRDSLKTQTLVSDLYTALTKNVTVPMINFIVGLVLPRLKMSMEVGERDRILSISKDLFGRLPNQLAGYAILFLVPILSCIADSQVSIRTLASELFGLLVRLVPLKLTIDTNQMSDTILVELQRAQTFLAQFMGDSPEDLLSGSHRRALAVPEFEIPVEIKAELRPYQKAGVNWLAFLGKFGLNGALCDDMGLGKTLQTICILASSHAVRKSENLPLRPSLVVCPASLVGHWRHEVESYAPSLGCPLVYAGNPIERRRLWPSSANPLVVITSYEVLRSDITTLGTQWWNYIVLDEGHVIKNPKTKLTAAVKSLRAEHRLILSGTPIQNNVVELWSLFDFLMPGMLGSESEFMDRYGRAIMTIQPHIDAVATGAGGNNSSNANNHNSGGNVALGGGGGTFVSGTGRNCSGGVKEFEEAEGKLKMLHKQVLPFVLRRMKEHVLKELPPKIIQDYESDPSIVQRILYNSVLADNSLRAHLKTSSAADCADAKPGMHIFKVLQYLRKICVHPALALTDDHPEMDTIQEALRHAGQSLEDLTVAPKLLLLKELLEECGIGRTDGGDSSEPGHRVLIFAQQKSTLDLIERLVLKKHLPQTHYMRLDGSVEQRSRFDIAQRFNADTSIEILLLTTQVGGLGLNLTGADTVIFVEHDWNPMRDLQAMDRAHRLGQKRVVTIYRLILRDTLEQQILGLQRWKTKVAATVIQQQDLETLNGAKLQSTDLLELLSNKVNNNNNQGNDEKSGGTKEGGKQKSKRSRTDGDGISKWLNLHGSLLEADPDPELRDNQNEYNAAFNVETFTDSILSPHQGTSSSKGGDNSSGNSSGGGGGKPSTSGNE